MPYIDGERRAILRNEKVYRLEPRTPGELNFLFTDIADDYIIETGGLSYAKVNEVIGALECAKLELYRRIAAPYEDEKRAANGDVYACDKQ